MSEPTISAYIQCHSNKAALFMALQSFRQWYPTEPVTLVSDAGEDFAGFADYFKLQYFYSPEQCDPGSLGLRGAQGFLKRIYDHCQSVDSEFVVILEEDVTTRRRIRTFPTTDCAGPRLNRFSDELTRHLQRVNGTAHDYRYVMCGGSIFRRRTFIACYERREIDLVFLSGLDPAVIRYGDVLLTTVFLINGYSSGVWEDASERYHPIEELRIDRDAAFDHADKRWYGAPFDETWLHPNASLARPPTVDEQRWSSDGAHDRPEVFTSSVRPVYGFYPAECDKDGRAWRWMAGVGVLGLSNAAADMMLTIRARVPDHITVAPTVVLEIDEQVLDTVVGCRVLDRDYQVSLSGRRHQSISTLRISTTETFVPAVMQATSIDQRRLGMVFTQVAWRPAER